MKRAALLSVSDRSGIVELARELLELGFVLLTTSGTGKALKEAGIPFTPIEEYTGQREILDGRVKTLHPKIHAGILAKREMDSHRAELEREQILPIDLVAVNLYPFIQNLESDKAADPSKMIELVDIGGPTMIRAAAKNFKNVLPLIDPADYSKALEILRRDASPAAEDVDTRRNFAVKVFTQLAEYNLEIARYFAAVGEKQEDGARGLGEVQGAVLRRAQELRYGENPHQAAGFFRTVSQKQCSWRQLHGKELSYNNLLDFDAALKLLRELGSEAPTSVIIKHLNPCGVARAGTLAGALQGAKRGDPRSHFGGVLGFNREVDRDVAEAIREDFAEIVLAPGYTAQALEVLRTSKTLRILTVDLESPGPQLELRVVEGGVLVQQPDRRVSAASAARQGGKIEVSNAQLRDLDLAWRICSHVKSNAITLVKDGVLIGVGAGQMSRIDSVELAIAKARRHGHDLAGAVAASDAFFPFPDNVEALAEAGVRAVISPSGAKRDEQVVAAADSSGVALLFSDDRHFRH